MPSNKNNHFVPRVHFKPFSFGREGKAINLVNIESGLAIQNASVSGQCSKSYFYGKDAEIEKGLSHFEGRYGQIERALEAHDPLSGDDNVALRMFTLLQFMRTEATGKMAVATISGGLDRMFVGELAEQRPSAIPNHVVMMMALSLALKERRCIDDLKMCVFANDTRIDFITSDNPAIAMNRWSWQRQRDHRFGLVSSGLILSLPLSPRMSLCYFDRGTYSCPGNGPVYRTLANHRDVHVLNELQILNSEENVYFADWCSRGTLLTQVNAVKERRPAERVLFNVLVEDENGTDGFHEGRCYRRATADEIARPMPKVVMHSPVYPIPSRWISGIRIRPRPRVFTNGSAAGYVRNPAWLTQEGRRRDGL